VGHIEEEWVVTGCGLLEEGHRGLGEGTLQHGLLGESSQHLCVSHQGKGVLVVAVGDAVEVIEALVCRQQSFAMTEVPLANARGAVACTSKHLCQCRLSGGEARLIRWGDDT
jgi:hypothetical protein